MESAPRVFDLIGVVDDAGFEEVRALEGKPIRVEQWNHEASLDAVRHYSLGLGDDNPLFTDPEYGQSTPYGDIIAPPTFPFTAFDGAVGAGLPGVQPIYAGTEWTFHRRIHRNSRIAARSVFGPVKRTTGQHAQELVLQSAITAYTDSDGLPLAEATAYTFRIPRRSASGGLSYGEREEQKYTADELDAIMMEAVSEFRRGSKRIDDVSEGEAIPAIVKGPIGRIDMTAYYAGLPGSPGYKSVELAWKYRHWARTEPNLLPNNYDPSYFSERVLPSIGHQDPAAAHELGMPNAYNNGPQRVGWFAHCISNWMGDGAFLRMLSVRLQRPEIFGDVIRIGGRVSRIDRGILTRYFVELEARNQLGETTATGSAEIVDDNYGTTPTDG